MDALALGVATLLFVSAMLVGPDRGKGNAFVIGLVLSIIFLGIAWGAAKSSENRLPKTTRKAYVIIGNDIEIDNRKYSGVIGVVKTTKDYPAAVLNTETITEIYKGPEFTSETLVVRY